MTEEVFTVVDRHENYASEILGGEERDYIIESILGKRKRNGVNEVFVQYCGNPTSANTW